MCVCVRACVCVCVCACAGQVRVTQGKEPEHLRRGVLEIRNSRSCIEVLYCLGQVRVTQGKEPEHLLRLFKGRFIVHNGGNPSAFRGAELVMNYICVINYICI